MNVPMLTTDFLDRAVDLFDDLVGVVAHDGTEFTYGAFGERVNRLSNALLELGLTQGDRVALLAPNTHYFLETLYATNQLGMVFMPLNYRLIVSDFDYILNDSEAAAIIADFEFADRIEPIRDDVPTAHFIGYQADLIDGNWTDYNDLIADHEPTQPDRPPLDEDDPATINYTSGTTGDPKGVVLTHRNEHYHTLLECIHEELTEDEVYLWTLPMFHCNGWDHLYSITGLGGTHICQRTFDPAGVFERIGAYDVTYMNGAPTVLNRLIAHHEEHDVESTGGAPVRFGVAGAAPPEATIRAIEEEFGWEIIHVYGMTEASPYLTINNTPRRLARGDTFSIKKKQGPAILGTKLRVVDEDGHDVPRDDESMGEIVARGNQIMDRYWNKREATEEAFNRTVEGWYHTGDIATWDEQGLISVKDRRKDIIISGGENISSVEVEDALYDHPAIEKVTVIAVPSEEWGETPKAIVVTKPGEGLSEEEVIDFARAKLAHYKCPTSVDFVDELPETATGKVEKYRLRERYWEGQETMVGKG